MIRQAEGDTIDHLILSSLYLRGPVRRSSIRMEQGAGTDLDGGLSRLEHMGMIENEGSCVRLTSLGERMAYSLACGERRPLHRLLEELGASLPSGRLLDLGCGPGVYLPEAARRRDLDVVGLDSDRDSLALADMAMARAGRRAPLVRAAAERLPFVPGCFDVILCVVVLPYVHEEKTLLEAARVLKRGGRMIITAHGAGYYLNLLAGRGMTLKRRLFGAASLARTLGGRAASWLPGARFQSLRGISATLARHGVTVAVARERPHYRGFSTGFLVLAEKGRGGPVA